ncbi:MAG TPA: hypothetical protein PKK96_09925 [Anaerolineales bacterium]|nr:hypothetical protein [Anaerolineales bacterium]HNQ94623.1 hypothetical protein [Anaerolineales bacterium]HNS61309.1 hypothetical protein [Anaerolineales bacterium]
MITSSNLLHLPYTRDLTEAGIAYALRSLPNTFSRAGSSSYDKLRRIVASVAVELAFRRYLSERNIPFDVKGAAPFTNPNRYDVLLGGRRCEIQSFFISRREQISEMKRNPQVILNAPALVPSDQNAAEGHSNSDIYLFAFLSGLVAASQEDLKKAIGAGQPHYLVHVMPDSWARPTTWNPLGKLVVKSEAEDETKLELGGQDERRETRLLEVEIPPRGRVEIPNEFCSLAYIRSKTPPNARIGLRKMSGNEAHVIGAFDWGNIWVYGMDIFLAGYLSREEFNRRATPIPEGARVFQYEKTRVKNLAVSVVDLKPVAELFERIKEHTV